MIVADVMQTDLVTVTPRTTLPEAVNLAAEHRIRHLPVMEEGRLVGIVSDRDLKRAMASPATSLTAHELNFLLDRLTVDRIMTRTVVTVPPATPVEDAARIMAQEKISSLPVTAAGELIGIITETDVLQLVVTAVGASEPSSRLVVPLGERRSALAEVIDALESAGAPVISVMTVQDRQHVRMAIVRVGTLHPGPGLAALAARGYTVRDEVRRQTA